MSDMQIRPQSFQLIPADRQFGAGAPDPKGKIAPAPGKDILYILQMNQVRLVDPIEPLSPQPFLKDPQGCVVTALFSGKSVDDAVLARAI